MAYAKLSQEKIMLKLCWVPTMVLVEVASGRGRGMLGKDYGMVVGEPEKARRLKQYQQRPILRMRAVF